MEITYEQIMSFNPCYDPAEEIGMPKDYKASLADFIKEYRTKVKDISDIHWVVLRKEFFNDRDLRLFAVWSARQVQHLMEDERSLKVLDIAEAFANGNATQEELAAARAAARAAAWAAARAAAWAAARDAAWAAARAGADAAARAGADAAARAGADAAAWAGADAARDAQIDMLLKMIEEPNGVWYKK